MTQPPPPYPGEQPAGPPPGYHPPPSPGGTYPPPPAGGYPPPPGYPAPGYAPFGPAKPYAGWWSRVGAYLIDGLLAFLVVVIPVAVGLVIAFIDVEYNDYSDEIVASSINWGGIALAALGALLGVLFVVWNRGIRQGSKGQSLGKTMLGIEVVSVETGQHLGAGMGVLRMILEMIFGNACFLDYLWPLWDDRKQSWHDMVVKSVVVQK